MPGHFFDSHFYISRAEEVTEMPAADRVMGGEQEYFFVFLPFFFSDQIIVSPKTFQEGSKPGGDGKMKLNLNLKVARYRSPSFIFLIIMIIIIMSLVFKSDCPKY